MDDKFRQQYIAELKSWLADFVAPFYDTDDSQLIEMVKLKEDHTALVHKNCVGLADFLQLDEHSKFLTEIMGLLHDVGRFPQFQKYHTFVDALSTDHARLGLATIEKYDLLKDLAADDREKIKFAIENHNKKAIAPTADERALTFAKLLRDADKLDIYRVLSPYLQPSDGSGISPGFIRQFDAGEQCDYNLIRTMDDRKLVRLMWVYDVNYVWTLRKIRERGYIDKIIRCLPSDGELAVGIERLRRYVAEKCNEN